ncbi:AraC family transcriptional regulator [Deinococcus metallilatus]|uniref:AraC-like DNA-binding protein n=1 Tax=Deinococcus metallilatus TaxID=1211322 RepID=A0ABR6MNR7_9DEIO|nr:AraC family transcriptional regulator [Deinococcus metallilatus]MBB5293578.1 AraC-like DNA-binding protein [Deinococcus metallilatus]
MRGRTAALPTGAVRGDEGLPERQESAQLWRLPNLPDLTLFAASFVRHTFVPHAHEHYVIAVHEAGLDRGTVGRRTVIVRPGTLSFLHPGEVHADQPGDQSGFAYRAFYPEPRLLQHIWRDLTGQDSLPHFRTNLCEDAALFARLQDLHRRLQQSRDLLEQESLLVSTFAHLLLQLAVPAARPLSLRPEKGGILRARDLLEADLSASPSLEVLAGVANLSPTHFLRAFRETCGLTPHAYLVQRRVQQAARLLEGGERPGQVAQSVGFVDQSHLNRHFKRLLGVTPAHYRRAWHS